jgi:DNA-binding CsgD family transcriptional regulator
MDERSERDVLRLLAEIYRAGLGEKSWVDALKSITAFFHAAGATAYDLNRATGSIPTLFVTDRIDGTQSEYVNRMNAINPRMHNALRRTGSFTTYDYDALPEEAIRRHEFYDWLEREVGVKYHVGSRMINSGDLSSFVSVEFDARHGHVEQDEIELFRALTPHIANAWRMSRCLAQASRIDDFNVMLLENAPWGAVTLDRCGRVLSINGPARAVIGRGDGLRVARGQLRAFGAADDRSLQIEIRASLKSARGEDVHPGGTLAIGRPGATAPYGLRVLPMRHVMGPLPEQVPFVVVLISDPVQPRLPSSDDLMAVFGLTPREAETALLVAQGMSLVEVAANMRIASSTARVHLANAMAKTGTHSQSALVGLVRGLPAGDERA